MPKFDGMYCTYLEYIHTKNRSEERNPHDQPPLKVAWYDAALRTPQGWSLCAAPLAPPATVLYCTAVHLVAALWPYRESYIHRVCVLGWAGCELD